jgi:hypothetical protein
MYPTIDSYHSPRKHEVLARSMRKIERTLDTVLRSLGNPSTSSAMISRSPSPTGLNEHGNSGIISQQIVATRELIDSDSESSPQTPQEPAAQGSPKLHSLPNDTLNPLGLLAETSLATRKTNSAQHGTLYPRPFDDTGAPKVGVASEVYFKPGEYPSLEPTARAQRELSRSNQYPSPSEAVHRRPCTARNAEFHEYRRCCGAVRHVRPQLFLCILARLC